VTGRTNRRFWKCFESLPAPVQKLAREKYALWKRDPHHRSLSLKSGVTEFASFASEITIALSAYVRAISSPGFGSAVMSNTTASGFNFFPRP
jgi:hypothetical protein